MSKHIFKLTWGWGGGKTFPTHKEMIQWRGEHEEEIEGMFPSRTHVLGTDGNWYELANDFCQECGAST